MAEFITCYKCGIYFGLPDHYLKCRREDKADFWCPNGHQQAFTESTADKLRRERDRLQQQMARVEEEASLARLRAEKAERATKRLKKRTAAGTCPCCQRTFSNMAEHMKHQHPEFVSETGAKVVPIKRMAR